MSSLCFYCKWSILECTIIGYKMKLFSKVDLFHYVSFFKVYNENFKSYSSFFFFKRQNMHVILFSSVNLETTYIKNELAQFFRIILLNYAAYYYFWVVEQNCQSKHIPYPKVMIRADNGPEFISSQLSLWCEENNITL